jgi:hypothetical protein
MRKKAALLWTLSFLITLSSAVYQRMTGPTYPLSGHAALARREIDYKLRRTHGGSSNHPVQIETGDPGISGEVIWKRYPTSDEWSVIPMQHKDGVLAAELPWQPPAGKLEYRVKLTGPEGASVVLPASGSAVIRFKGDVPAPVLILHIVAMFGAMLLSTRAGLEYFSDTGASRWLVPWTLGLLFVGGIILGPVVQKYAFGAYWTGWPVGTDLTDNNTAVAFLGWVSAYFLMRRSRRPLLWGLLAAVVLLVVFMIPHSLLGSELKYEDGKPIPSQLGP